MSAERAKDSLWQDNTAVALDAFSYIYLWVGSKASNNLKLIAPKLAAVHSVYILDIGRCGLRLG